MRRVKTVTTPEQNKEVEDFLAENGFDMSRLPYRKGNWEIYKNTWRDGSGDFDGYMLVSNPLVRSQQFRNKEEFLELIGTISLDDI